MVELFQKIAFAKMEGLGNKILVLDLRNFFYSSHIFAKENVLELVRKGYDFDQLMVLYKIDAPNFLDKNYQCAVEIWNGDGSKSQACGNGTRCVFAYLYHSESPKKENFQISLYSDAGKIKGRYLYRENEEDFTEVELPPPAFDEKSIGLKNILTREELLKFGLGGVYYPEFLSLGNPHAVFFINKPLKEMHIDDWLQTYGPQLEHSKIFKNKCNITISHIISTKNIEVRTWERGAGLTKACGTGACAAMVSGRLRGILEDQVLVNLPIGTLDIMWRYDTNSPIIMKGPSNFVGKGVLEMILKK